MIKKREAKMRRRSRGQRQRGTNINSKIEKDKVKVKDLTKGLKNGSRENAQENRGWKELDIVILHVGNRASVTKLDVT